MLILFTLLIAKHCYNRLGRPLDRAAIFISFENLNGNSLHSKNCVSEFIKECSSNENFTCLVDDRMNKECLDFYSHIFKIYSQVPESFKHFRISEDSRIYSRKALDFMVVKSIFDDDPVMLSFFLNLYSLDRKLTFQSLRDFSLSSFDGMPNWAIEFNSYFTNINQADKLTGSVILSKYALAHEKAKTFMFLYFYFTSYRVPVISISLDYLILENVEFGVLREIQKIFEHPDNIYMPLSYYIFNYFRAMSVWTPENASRETLESIKTFAESHLKNYHIEAINMEFLLIQSDLKDYKTFELLKSKIKDRVMQAYLRYQSCYYLPNLAGIDVYYANVDLVTDKKWIDDWRLKYKQIKSIRGLSAARHEMKFSYRGVIMSQCKDDKISKLILEDVTGYTAYLFIGVSGILAGKKEVTYKVFLRQLLNSDKHAHVVMALTAIQHIALDGNSASNEVPYIAGTVQSLSDVVENTTGISKEFGCLICFGSIDDIKHLRILPCGHLYHVDCIESWENVRTRSGFTVACPFCNMQY
eukprot:NODE_901_length_3242_cov_0.168629.p1 type:complete len:528 gc:universal NODE_901_length_3242_cov_0.168629:536-2119(+)